MKNLLIILILITLIATMMTGCGESDENNSIQLQPSNSEATSNSNSNSIKNNSDEQSASATDLYVKFGDEGVPFIMNLYDNETATAIAHHVGTNDWRIPIYNYEGYDNWEVMQYYDIPSQYEIPSNPESITNEKVGTVYYSEPNRIVLFYGDAQVAGEYTPIGYFDVTEDFLDAVKNNPVLEGWSNKIIHITANENSDSAQIGGNMKND